MTVYLLHFARRLHHAGHYIGTAEDLDARLALHRAGRGARLLAVIRAAGIGFVLARTWDGGRALERRLKRRKCGPRLCPLCSGRPRGTAPAGASGPTSHVRREAIPF